VLTPQARQQLQADVAVESAGLRVLALAFRDVPLPPHVLQRAGIKHLGAAGNKPCAAQNLQVRFWRVFLCIYVHTREGHMGLVISRHSFSYFVLNVVGSLLSY
jgi:hypothetical protein